MSQQPDEEKSAAFEYRRQEVARKMAPVYAVFGSEPPGPEPFKAPPCPDFESKEQAEAYKIELLDQWLSGHAKNSAIIRAETRRYDRGTRAWEVLVTASTFGDITMAVLRIPSPLTPMFSVRLSVFSIIDAYHAGQRQGKTEQQQALVDSFKKLLNLDLGSTKG